MNGLLHHYLPVSGVGNLRTCCLPWMWYQFLMFPLRNQTLIPHYCPQLCRQGTYIRNLIGRKLERYVIIARAVQSDQSYPTDQSHQQARPVGFDLINLPIPTGRQVRAFVACISSRITTVIQVTVYDLINRCRSNTIRSLEGCAYMCMALYFQLVLEYHRQISWHQCHNRFNALWQCTARWRRLCQVCLSQETVLLFCSDCAGQLHIYLGRLGLKELNRAKYHCYTHCLLNKLQIS